MMLQTNVLEYLERSAAQFGGKIAFADEQERVTFSQMRRQAAGLGTRLAAELGGGCGAVAVLTDRRPGA